MFRVAKISLFVFCSVLLTSCQFVSSFLHDEDVVAQVGESKLFKSELDKVMPKDLSEEDSVMFAQRYIKSWASDIVFLNVAQKQLSEQEQDVSKELEEYRKSLLKYRYEQLYVNERLDTNVVEDVVKEYYESYPEKFRLKRPILKARFLSMMNSSPYLDDLKKKISSSDPEDLIEADSLAYTHALKYNTWNEEWVDAEVLAREYPMDYKSMLSLMKGKWIEYNDTLGVVYLTYVSDFIRNGEMSPVEFCTQDIKDIIINDRKHKMVSSLENDLLESARQNGDFVIY